MGRRVRAWRTPAPTVAGNGWTIMAGTRARQGARWHWPMASVVSKERNGGGGSGPSPVCLNLSTSPSRSSARWTNLSGDTTLRRRPEDRLGIAALRKGNACMRALDTRMKALYYFKTAPSTAVGRLQCLPPNQEAFRFRHRLQRRWQCPPPPTFYH